jgi:hypothetical protein
MSTSKRHKGHLRQFIINSQAWHGRASRQARGVKPGEDDITLGFYNPEGGTSGEFTIRWRQLDSRVVPYLHAFEDSWSALANFHDVITGLAELDGTNPTVEAVAQVLLACGVRDATERQSPYEGEAPEVTRDDVDAAVRLLRLYSATFERVRNAGREMRAEPNWAEGLEHKPGILDGTKGVPSALITELMNAAQMIQAQRTALRVLLQELRDPELTAQYQDLVHPPR